MTARTTRDAFLGGRLTLIQPASGHRAGTDAVLLAAAVEAGPGDHAVDLGAGVGAAGLSVARRTGARVTLVERDEGIAALAVGTIAENGLGEQVRLVIADVEAPAGARRAAGLEPGLADIVLANPPFHVEGRVRASPDAYRRAAHQAEADPLTGWARAAAALLKPGGHFVLIHRADAIGRVLAALAGRFGDIRLRPVQPDTDTAATRILVRATKGRRSAPTLLPPLILHENGRFTSLAERLHRGDASLGWDVRRIAGGRRSPVALAHSGGAGDT